MEQFIVCLIEGDENYRYHALVIIPAINEWSAIVQAREMGFEGELTAFNFQELTNDL